MSEAWCQQQDRRGTHEPDCRCPPRGPAHGTALAIDAKIGAVASELLIKTIMYPSITVQQILPDTLLVHAGHERWDNRPGQVY
jgi:hypothetical protein